MKEFILMKIVIAEKTISECEAKQGSYNNVYDEGFNDGYIEALTLELQTLEQIIDKLKD